MSQTINDMMDSLRPLLPRRDRIGYVAARNMQALRRMADMEAARDALIARYGTPLTDSEGRYLGRHAIPVGSPAHRRLVMELGKPPELTRLPYSVADGELTGEEILACEWMFEEG